MPLGSAIRLEADPALDRVDRYGRLLRYVWRGSVNVNVELVRQGAATPYFYRGERGKYAALLLAAARQAKARGRGLWGQAASAGFGTPYWRTPGEGERARSLGRLPGHPP